MSKTIFMFSVLLALIILISLFFGLILRKPAKNGSNNQIPRSSITPSSSSVTQTPFKIVETNPSDGAQDVTPGETTISFSTDNSILVDDSFNIIFKPTLPGGYKFTNSFPNKTITLVVLGGLEPSTNYQVSVTNKEGQKVYSWDFTTSKNNTGLSSSALQGQIEQDYYSKNYPLNNYTPYSTSDFEVEYAGKPLTLNVKVKNPDINKVKQEVNDWIKSKGVDPSTHTINYLDNF